MALAAAEAAAVKENLATKAEQSRHAACRGAPCTEAAQRFYAAFEIDEHGFPRNKAAAERMVAKVVGPLGSLSTDQQAAVLTAAIKRPALREAANRAGIGQASLGERIVDRVKSAFTSQGIKRGSLGADIEASVDSFFNLAPPTPNEEVMQRGKHAKKQKAAGGEAKVAPVVGIGAGPVAHDRKAPAQGRGGCVLDLIPRARWPRHRRGDAQARARLLHWPPVDQALADEERHAADEGRERREGARRQAPLGGEPDGRLYRLREEAPRAAQGARVPRAAAA